MANGKGAFFVLNFEKHCGPRCHTNPQKNNHFNCQNNINYNDVRKKNHLMTFCINALNKINSYKLCKTQLTKKIKIINKQKKSQKIIFDFSTFVLLLREGVAMMNNSISCFHDIITWTTKFNLDNFLL